MDSKTLNEILLPGVDIEITIDAQLLWREPSENTMQKCQRQQAAHVVRGLGRDLEKPIKEILEQMIFQRMQLDG